MAAYADNSNINRKIQYSDAPKVYSYQQNVQYMDYFLLGGLSPSLTKQRKKLIN
jgi:hypothetical protein